MLAQTGLASLAEPPNPHEFARALKTPEVEAGRPVWYERMKEAAGRRTARGELRRRIPRALRAPIAPVTQS